MKSVRLKAAAARTVRYCAVIVCAFDLFRPVCASAQNSGVHISQLAHKAWRLREGEVPGAPNAVAQTSDGYMWVGAESGLFRFNGEIYQAIQAPAPDHILRVNSLLADKDGTLWVGAGNSLYHLRQGTLHKMPGVHKVLQMFQNSSGDVWIATENRSKLAACRIRHEVFDCPAGLGMDVGGFSIADDGAGGFWVSNSDHLKHRNADGSVGLGDGQIPWHSQIIGLGSDGRGHVWIAVHEVGKLAQLFQWNGQSWQGLPTLPGLRGSSDIQTVFVDRENALWIGTSDVGLYRVTTAGTDQFNQADGLSNNQISDIKQDAAGSIWVATSGGVDEFHRSLVDSWSTREGLSADGVSAITVDRAGRVWMSNTGGLDVLENGSIHSYRPNEGLPGSTVTGLATDAKGRVWVGIDNGLWILDAGKFQHVLAPDGKELGLVVNMREDAAGQMWIRASKRLFRSTEGGLQLVEWPYSNLITTFNPDPVDGMWIGARNMPAIRVPGNAMRIETTGKPSPGDSFRSLFRWHDTLISQTQQRLAVTGKESTAVLNRTNGLKYEVQYASALAPNGDVYLMTDGGYLRITAEDFGHWMRDPHATIAAQTIDTADGAITGASTFGPASAVTPYGDLWFATNRFPQRIVPAMLQQPRHSAPLLIEAVLADGTPVSDIQGFTLRPGVGTLEIQYASLSYQNPKRIEYRYQLEGYDTDWRYAGQQRQVQYSHLPPDTYRFRVQARDRDGRWDATEAVAGVHVLPRFYQTIWFKSLAGFFVLLALWLVYLARLRYLVGRAQATLFERVSERERIARDLHDTFFQGIQGLLLRFQTGTSALPTSEPVRPMFEELLKQSDQVMHEGRELVLDLRTPFGENEDLGQALATVCTDLQATYPIKFSVTVHGKATPLQARTSEEIYRIAKEALTNAFMHSAAKSIEVELSFEYPKFVLRVRDDGRGIDPAVQEHGGRAGHFGLTGMRERAKKIGATLELWSQADAGTEIQVTLQSALSHRAAAKSWGWMMQLKDSTFRGLSS